MIQSQYKKTKRAKEMRCKFENTPYEVKSGVILVMESPSGITKEGGCTESETNIGSRGVLTEEYKAT